MQTVSVVIRPELHRIRKRSRVMTLTESTYSLWTSTALHTFLSIVPPLWHMAIHVLLFYQVALYSRFILLERSLALVPFLTLYLSGWIVQTEVCRSWG